jgi:hypothetical protein
VATRPDKRPHRWCDGLPAVTVEIDCGGQRHRITWRRGKLVLEDHDLLAERSLAALGSSRPPVCVEVLDAWRRTRATELLWDFPIDDRPLPPDEIVRRRRRDEEESLRVAQFASVASTPAVVRREFERRAAAELARDKRMWDMALIDSLPAALRMALAASVIVTVKRRWHDEEYRRRHVDRLERTLLVLANPLLERSARRWRRSLKPQAIFRVESRLLAPGEPASCSASVGPTGASASLSLPVSWFLDVWARGIALVDECFVLGLGDRTPDATSLRVVAVRWERDRSGASRPVQVPAIARRRCDGEWSLHWA